MKINKINPKLFILGGCFLLIIFLILLGDKIIIEKSNNFLQLFSLIEGGICISIIVLTFLFVVYCKDKTINALVVILILSVLINIPNFILDAPYRHDSLGHFSNSNDILEMKYIEKSSQLYLSFPATFLVGANLKSLTQLDDLLFLKIYSLFICFFIILNFSILLKYLCGRKYLFILFVTLLINIFLFKIHFSPLTLGVSLGILFLVYLFKYLNRNAMGVDHFQDKYGAIKLAVISIIFLILLFLTHPTTIIIILTMVYCIFLIDGILKKYMKQLILLHIFILFLVILFLSLSNETSFQFFSLIISIVPTIIKSVNYNSLVSLATKFYSFNFLSLSRIILILSSLGISIYLIYKNFSRKINIFISALVLAIIIIFTFIYFTRLSNLYTERILNWYCLLYPILIFKSINKKEIIKVGTIILIFLFPLFLISFELDFNSQAKLPAEFKTLKFLGGQNISRNQYVFSDFSDLSYFLPKSCVKEYYFSLYGKYDSNNIKIAKYIIFRESSFNYYSSEGKGMSIINSINLLDNDSNYSLIYTNNQNQIFEGREK